MNTNSSILALLISKFTHGLRADEQPMLDNWTKALPENERYYKSLRSEPYVELMGVPGVFDKQESFRHLESLFYPEYEAKPPKTKPRAFFLIAAAILIATIGITVWMIQAPVTKRVSDQPNPSLPGLSDINLPANSTILVLENGQLLMLDSLRDGILDSTAASTITQRGDSLFYKRVYTTKSTPTTPKYNIIQIPNHRTKLLFMPDGTLVALSPGTTIRFPVTYDSTARLVELTGQAFFDVKGIRKAGASLPFIIKVQNFTVEVIGTRFFIDAYKESSSVKTMVLKGSVNVSNKNNRYLLHPGEQATVQKKTGELKVHAVDTSQLSSFQPGDFIFINETFHDVLTTIAQRFNKKVVYTKPYNRKTDHYTGAINGTRTLESTLYLLQKYQEVILEVKGDKIIVKPTE